MYNYSVKIISNKKELSTDYYDNALEALCKIALVLDQMSCFELFDKGTFDATVFDGVTYHKRYVITCDSPNFQIILNKEITGDINQDLLKEYVKETKILYERNNNRLGD